MCRNPVLWPQGQSFCRDQSESFRLSPRSTYWHIQMPSVYCENRSIGWNNTVTGDNVPVRDDLWSSFGFTDSGAFMCFPQQLQSLFLCGSFSHPQHGTSAFLFFFWALFFSSLVDFPLFSQSFHTFIYITIPNNSHHKNQHLILTLLPCSPYEPTPFTPLPPAACLG